MLISYVSILYIFCYFSSSKQFEQFDLWADGNEKLEKENSYGSKILTRDYIHVPNVLDVRNK